MATHRPIASPVRSVTPVTTQQGVMRIRGPAGEPGSVLTPLSTLRMTFENIVLNSVCLSLGICSGATGLKATAASPWSGTVDVPLAASENNCDRVLIDPGPSLAWADGGACTTANTVTQLLFRTTALGTTSGYQSHIRLSYDIIFGHGPIFFEALIDHCDMQEGVAVDNLVLTGGVCYTVADGTALTYHALGSGGTVTLTHICPP